MRSATAGRRFPSASESGCDIPHRARSIPQGGTREIKRRVHDDSSQSIGRRWSHFDESIVHPTAWPLTTDDWPLASPDCLPAHRRLSSSHELHRLRKPYADPHCSAAAAIRPYAAAITLGCWHNFGSPGSALGGTLSEPDFHENCRRILFTAFDHGITHLTWPTTTARRRAVPRNASADLREDLAAYATNSSSPRRPAT